MADGSHFESRGKSRYLKNHQIDLIKFGMLMHIGLLNPMGQKKIRTQISNTTEGHHSENENRHLPFYIS